MVTVNTKLVKQRTRNLNLHMDVRVLVLVSIIIDFFSKVGSPIAALSAHSQLLIQIVLSADYRTTVESS